MEDIRPWEWNWTIIVAFFAAIVALLGSVFAIFIARQNIRSTARLQISDYRRAWINDLRAAMIEFLELALEFGVSAESVAKTAHAMAKIQLLLNPEDPSYKKLLAQMSIISARKFRLLESQSETPEVEKAKWSTDTSVQDDFTKYGVSQFSDICQQILKREWDRLKDDIENENA